MAFLDDLMLNKFSRIAYSDKHASLSSFGKDSLFLEYRLYEG